MSHVGVRRRSFGLQLFLIAVALVFAAGVSTTMSSAHAQMESPPLPPPMPPPLPPPPPPMPTSPMPQFSGSWTEADPFTIDHYSSVRIIRRLTSNGRRIRRGITWPMSSTMAWTTRPANHGFEGPKAT